MTEDERMDAMGDARQDAIDEALAECAEAISEAREAVAEAALALLSEPDAEQAEALAAVAIRLQGKRSHPFIVEHMRAMAVVGSPLHVAALAFVEADLVLGELVGVIRESCGIDAGVEVTRGGRRPVLDRCQTRQRQRPELAVRISG
jgi:hypothetical protein